MRVVAVYARARRTIASVVRACIVDSGGRRLVPVKNAAAEEHFYEIYSARDVFFFFAFVFVLKMCLLRCTINVARLYKIYTYKLYGARACACSR